MNTENRAEHFARAARVFPAFAAQFDPASAAPAPARAGRIALLLPSAEQIAAEYSDLLAEARSARALGVALPWLSTDTRAHLDNVESLGVLCAEGRTLAEAGSHAAA